MLIFKKRPNTRNVLLILLAFSALFTSCVTQKKKGDVSKAKKIYHDITAHYNGYYNANVLIMESIDKLNEFHQDNYNQILDVYTYSEVEDAKPVFADLDESIKKSSVVISLHRPSKWTDDSYLNIAKAQFLKKDYESAEETLLYLGDEYSPSAMAKREAKRKRGKKHKKRRKKRKPKKKKSKKRKRKSQKKAKKKKMTKEEMRERYKERKRAEANEGKKEVKKEVLAKTKKDKKKKGKEEEDKGKKKYGLFKHKPAYQKGQLWLARNYTQRKMYEDAAYVLRRLENSQEVFKRLKPEVAKAKADLLLKQGKYRKAIPALEEAVGLIRKKKKKTRLLYILGQLYQKDGQEKAALDAFAKVVKYKPTYEMAFSAKMNVALDAWLSGSSTAEQAIASLEKLLKDRKNKDYKDQLYFTLAKLYMKQGYEAKTIAALENSLENNSGNRSQTAESSLMLADLYFAKDKFIEAKEYYDMALLAMDKSDERYDQVAKYSQNLTEIASNLAIIQMQDSLLTFAAKPKSVQRALAIKMLEEKLEKEAIAKATEDAKNINAKAKTSTNTSIGVKSTFFAYDQSKVKKGRRIFEKTWGDRPLIDNWRRSSSQSLADSESVSTAAEVAETYSEADINAMLTGIPNTVKEKKKANGLVYQAMFNLGVLYRDRLESPKRSLTVLEDMLKRYPDSTKNELDAYYYAYLSSGDLSLATKKKYYHDLILKEYANSKFARVLKDPNYLNELNKNENRINTYFDETYALYKAAQYQKASARVSKVKQLFGPKNPLEAKFSLLSAMLGGAMNGRKEYIVGLKQVVARFKNTEEEKRAKEILRVLGEDLTSGVGSVGNASTKTKIKSKFAEGMSRSHFMLVSLPEGSVVNDIKKAISNFNKTYFKLQHFRISSIFLGSNIKNPILVIRKFKNGDKAMVYYEGLVSDEDLKSFISKAKVYPITQANYRKILRQKSLEGYEAFFENTYK